MRDLKPLFLMASCLILIFGCTEHKAPDTKIPPTENTPLPVQISERTLLRIHNNPASAEKSFVRAFKKIAVNETVSIEKIQDYANSQTAIARAQIVIGLLSLDTNGDSDISAKEMLSVSATQISKWRRNDQSYLPYSEANVNDDNIISLKENFLFARKYATNAPQAHQSYEITLSLFDTDKDGTLTRSELDLELEALLYSDHKAEQKKGFNTKTSHPSSLMQSPPPACKPTPPTSDTKVIFVSGYEGSGLSSVALTGLNRETEVARIFIEDGKTPLYIMASSHTPLIWSIEGHTERIEKFVVGRNSYSKGAGAGVVGLTKNNVEFLGRGCLSYFSNNKDSKAILSRAQWGNLIEQKPDNIFGNYTINALQLPSGINKPKNNRGLTIIDKRQENTVELVWDNSSIRIQEPPKSGNSFGLYRYTVDGLIVVDPKSVIAPEPIEPYDVYPQQAGLVQLVEAGKLEALERNSFRIIKPIARFPAGLNGGHSVKFILGKGVPLPNGSPGHSSVYSEETGECLTRTCR